MVLKSVHSVFLSRETRGETVSSCLSTRLQELSELKAVQT